MSQSSIIALALGLSFLVFVTLRGELTQYLQILL